MATDTEFVEQIPDIGSWWRLMLDEKVIYLRIRYRSAYTGNVVEVSLTGEREANPLFSVAIPDRDWDSLLRQGMLSSLDE